MMSYYPISPLTISKWQQDEYGPAITLLGLLDTALGTGFPSITYLSPSTWDGHVAQNLWNGSIWRILTFHHECDTFICRITWYESIIALTITDPASHLHSPVPSLQCFQVSPSPP